MAANQSNAGTIASKATVLVIEDEAPMASLLERAFSKAGYHSLLATDGVQAIGLYHDHKETIDAVLIDLGLPQITGCEVIQAIRNENSTARIIVTTGFLQPEMERELLRLGVQHCIQKPYSVDRVIETLAAVLAEK